MHVCVSQILNRRDAPVNCKSGRASPVCPSIHTFPHPPPQTGAASLLGAKLKWCQRRKPASQPFEGMREHSPLAAYEKYRAHNSFFLLTFCFLV